MFEESRAYVSTVLRDLVDEMLHAEAGFISKEHAAKMRTLAMNTLGVTAQTLQRELGNVLLGSPLNDLIVASDSREIKASKVRRIATRLMMATLEDISKLSKVTATQSVTHVYRDKPMVTEELFTLDFVRSLESQWHKMSTFLNEASGSPTSIQGEHAALRELDARIARGDPFSVSIASRLIEMLENHTGDAAGVLSDKLGTDRETATAVIKRVRGLHEQLGVSSPESVSECLELSLLVLQVAADVWLHAQG